MQRAVFAGSFDPPTLGHVNVIDRCSTIFSHICVLIANNSAKRYSITAEKRKEFLQRIVTRYENVSIYIWDRLIVDFAKEHAIKVIIRGVRALEDFEYEFQLSMINKGLDSTIETLFMPTDPRYFVLRSSAIKELVRLGGDISSMVPAEIKADVIRHYSPERR